MKFGVQVDPSLALSLRTVAFDAPSRVWAFAFLLLGPNPPDKNKKEEDLKE